MCWVFIAAQAFLYLFTGLGRSPGGGHGNPLQYFFFFFTPVFLTGKSHGQKNLVGYSPCGHKESNTTETASHTQPPRIQNKIQEEGE